MNLHTIIDGRFELLEILGAGGFGTVYRARQRVLDINLRDVALKVFHGDAVNHTNAQIKLNEAIQLMRLADEDPDPDVAQHMVRVIDAFVSREAPRRVILVMELVPERRTLQNAIQEFAPMPVDVSLSYLRQILRPLRWMHQLPVPRIHNDLKPENILLTGREQVKVGDFGLAAVLPGMAFGGTLPYQAAETLHGQSASASADVFALGALWYEMLAGRGPFHDVELEANADGDEARRREMHMRARRQPIPPVTEFNPSLQHDLAIQDILDRTLRFYPNDRYKNAEHLWNDLEVYAKNGRVTVPSAPKGLAAVEPSRIEQSSERLRDQAMRLAERGNFDEAMRLTLQITKQEPDNAAHWYARARIAAQAKRLDEAYEAVQHAQQLLPTAAETFDLWADVYDADGEAELANQARDKAINLRRKRTR